MDERSRIIFYILAHAESNSILRIRFPHLAICESCGLRYSRLVSLTIGTILSVGTGTGAHVANRVYPLVELTDDMLALIDLKDGSIEDWFDVVGEPTLTHPDFSVGLNAGSEELGDGDLKLRIWLAWHRNSNRIVVGSVFVDNVYENRFSGDAGDSFENNDSVVLLIDGDHSGPPYGDQSIEHWNVEAQMFNAIPEVPEGPTLELTSSSEIGRPEWMVLPPYADAGGHSAGLHPTAWFVEFSVTPFDLIAWDDPEQSRPSRLEAGRIVGLGIFVLDHDASDGQALTLHNLPGTSYLDGLAADAVLLDANGGDTDSAVESNSWGRIKAALAATQTITP